MFHELVGKKALANNGLMVWWTNIFAAVVFGLNAVLVVINLLSNDAVAAFFKGLDHLP